MAKGSDWYAACPHCKGSGSSDEPKEPRVHYRGDGSITPKPKYTENHNKKKGVPNMSPNTKKDSQMQHVSAKEKKSKEPHAPNKEKYPDYKPKNPPMGGSSVTRKPKPKSPAGGAAKNR